MLVNFLFWNMRELPRENVVAALAKEHNAQIVILAECQQTGGKIHEALEEATGRAFYQPWSGAKKIRILTSFPERSLRAVFDDPAGRLTIRRLIVGKRDILLAAVHFPSKTYWSESDQSHEAGNLARDIAWVENDRGHRRTILVGDFNMNPFEPGMIASHGLHAIMTKDLAREESRQVNGRPYHFFYNPMWGHFGDREPGPAGTYFYRAANPVTYFWNMFDQVLIRPALLNALNGEVKIITSAGGESLLTRSGRPGGEFGSDHLPLVFSLDLE